MSDYFQNQDIESILFARDQTQKILNEIISVIKLGLRESEVYTIAKDIYRDYGIVRSWHNPYIRFGINTCLTYKDRVVEDILYINLDRFIETILQSDLDDEEYIKANDGW